MCGRIGEDSYTGVEVTLETRNAWVMMFISTNGRLVAKAIVGKSPLWASMPLCDDQLQMDAKVCCDDVTCVC